MFLCHNEEDGEGSPSETVVADCSPPPAVGGFQRCSSEAREMQDRLKKQAAWSKRGQWKESRNRTSRSSSSRRSMRETDEVGATTPWGGGLNLGQQGGGKKLLVPGGE